MKKAATKKLKMSELPYDLGHILNHARRVLHSPLLDEVEAEIRKIAKAYLKRLQRYGYARREELIERSRGREYLLCTSYGSRIISFLIGYPKKAPKISWVEAKNESQPHLRPHPFSPAGHSQGAEEA